LKVNSIHFKTAVASLAAAVFCFSQGSFAESKQFTSIKIEVILSGERIPDCQVIYPSKGSQKEEPLEFSKRYPADLELHAKHPAVITVKVFGSTVEKQVVLVPGRTISFKESSLLKGPVVTILH
jgi:hypothetical protein